MTLSDIIVIYLSCGSPFAVHHLLTDTSRNSWRTVATTGLTLTLWPIFAVMLLIGLLRQTNVVKHSTGRDDLQSGLRQLLSDIESLSYVDSRTSEMFGFRDIYERYSGLCIALTAKSDENLVAEVFETIGHPNAEIATACLARVAKAKLIRHVESSRADFVDAIVTLADQSEFSDRLLHLAMETADAVNDPECSRQLALRSRSHSAISLEITESDDAEHLWISPEQTRSTVN